MAKLSKNEIEAVANKAYRTLKETAEYNRNEAMKKYTPSEIYQRVTKIAEERDAANKIYAECVNELNKILKPEYSCWSCGEDKIENLQYLIINKECKLSEVPSKESLIDDVTIAAIDRDFDTAKFIENLVAKFNS